MSSNSGTKTKHTELSDIESKTSNNGMDYGHENFLKSGECLVYLENMHPFADVNGSTQIARILRSYISSDNILWYDLILITDSDGDQVIGLNPITVSGDRIITNKSRHNIARKQIYHFASLTFSEGIEYPITADKFIIKKNLTKPLESTSRSALGSGIYGRYIENADEVASMLVEDAQSVYIIDCPYAYVIQDKEHGESITIASLATNRYMDRIIQYLRGDNVDNIKSALTFIQINESPNILTLWNIVFHRSDDFITKDMLTNILAHYAIDYITNNTLIDSINGEAIHELPINDIMRGLSYDGLIADDLYNNGWNRGCVSYNYSQAVIIQGETSKY